MSRGLTGRADLVAALRAGEQLQLNATASLLGFEPHRPRHDDESNSLESSDGSNSDQTRQKTSRSGNAEQWTQFKPVPVEYWQLVHHTDFNEEAAPRVIPGTTSSAAKKPRPTRTVTSRPLATRQEILTALRKFSARRIVGCQPDIGELTNRISNAEFIDKIPLKCVRSWSSTLHVIIDRSRRLTPFWNDQHFVCDILKQIYPDYTLTISDMLDRDQVPIVTWPESREGTLQSPSEAATVLVLGDMGCLITDDDLRESVQQFWGRMGQQWQDKGSRGITLFPSRLAEFSESLAQFWTPIAWEHGTAGPSEDAPLQTLLALCSRASRLEPGLMRGIRRMMPGGHGRPELESYLWQHDAVSSRHVDAASFDSERIQPFRDRFSESTDHRVRMETCERIRDWHSSLHRSVWSEEVLMMDGTAQAHFVEDVKDAINQFEEIAHAIEVGDSTKSGDAGFIGAARDFLNRIPPDLWHNSEIAAAVHRIHNVVHVETDQQVSRGMQPRLIPDNDSKQITLQIWQQRDQFVVTSSDADTGENTGRSWLGSVRTQNRQLKISYDRPAQWKTRSSGSEEDAFWQSGQAPDWAYKWGADEHGLWCSFLIETVEQVMRWVPSGSFLMGSPNDEAERFGDEGPQHEVTISNGFWMFETPCTQALWEAVMGQNDSDFKGPQRPVENVSWHDSQKFTDRLNKQWSGFELNLPTEAQWEFSCRAGSPDARYGELSDIAWFDANSDGQTHDVKEKIPNRLGLYDMLGNVWEWCLDHGIHDYTAEASIDPLSETDDAGGLRVIRGGSWYGSAQLVRAAYRLAYHPEERYLFLGFRCLSSSEQSKPREAAMSESALPRGGARKTANSESLRSDEIFLAIPRPRQFTWHDDATSVRFNTPETSWLHIESDKQAVLLHRSTGPSWAVRSGRDQFGLWAEFEYKRIAQRLRWVPPGQFLMGSAAAPQQSWLNEVPQNSMSIEFGFWMFDTPCTQELFSAVLGEKRNTSEFQSPLRPVENISWHDSQSFIERVNEQIPNLCLALPTEAEWEYACRAGCDAERYGDIDAIAWYDKNSRGQTHDVKQREPNPWGLFDMLGNVWEWCRDAPRDYSVPLPDIETAPAAGGNRVIRGGSWSNSAQRVRAAYRGADPPRGAGPLPGLPLSEFL